MANPVPDCDIAVYFKEKMIIQTWSTLGLTEDHLYKMVDPLMVIKVKDGQPVPPGPETWYIEVPSEIHGGPPYGLVPGSGTLLGSNNYVLRIVENTGLEAYIRPKIQSLNWDNRERTKRDSTFSKRIREAYTQCAITQSHASSDRIDTLQAAHVCPVSANLDMWDTFANHFFNTDTCMTPEFLESTSNGILLRADIHIAFDIFAISVVQVPGQWAWRVVVFHPSFQNYANSNFTINQPADAADRERLLCTLRLHFVYATQKFAGKWFPI
ncbi:hypothetical protein C8Q78DRAFT_1081095 [Trametes maxima]|nr:hypothetical protein C8Q78DRAFT_1081095 [Trametes maxima]